MALRRRPPDIEEWGVIRDKYEHTEMSLTELCIEHRISLSTLCDRARRWGWTRRRALIPLHGPPPRLVAPPSAPPLQPEATTAAGEASATLVVPAPSGARPPEDTRLATRLERALEGQVAAIEAATARTGGLSGYPGLSERTARTLATLTRTLRELNELQDRCAGTEGHEHDIDERRRALARKIDAIIARRADRADDGPEPTGA